MSKAQCTSLGPSMCFGVVCTEAAPLDWDVGVISQVIDL